MAQYDSHVIGYRGVYVKDYTPRTDETPAVIDLTNSLDDAMTIDNQRTAEMVLTGIRKTDAGAHMVVIPVSVTVSLARRI